MMLLKRGVDILLGLILLGLTAPLQLATALIVALDLRPPVLFHQLRAGRDGTTFRLFKFRSMQLQPSHGPALADEDRVTPAGLFIRRFRLDELPQILLILSGAMSLVGPRPLYPSGHAPENDFLFRYRHKVRPGLTGWAQVNGNTLLSEHEKLALDAVYVSKASLSFDLWILWLTLLTVVRGERRNPANIERALSFADRLDRSG